MTEKEKEIIEAMKSRSAARMRDAVYGPPLDNEGNPIPLSERAEDQKMELKDLTKKRRHELLLKKVEFVNLATFLH